MKRHIEIRPAEGGADARDFAQDLMRSYIRLSSRKG